MELETAVEAAASAPEATIFTTATSPFLITHANAAWTRLCGWEASEVVGLTCGVLQGDETDRQALATLHEALDAQEAAEVRLINYTKSGRRFEQTLAIEPVTESGRVTHFRGILRPVDGGAPSAAGGAEDPMWAESKLLGERLAAHGLENLSLTDMLRAMAPLLPGSKALGLIVLVRGVLVGELQLTQDAFLAHVRLVLGEHSTVLRAVTARLGGQHALLLEQAAQAAAAAQQAQLDWELQHLSAELQRSGG